MFSVQRFAYSVLAIHAPRLMLTVGLIVGEFNVIIQIHFMIPLMLEMLWVVDRRTASNSGKTTLQRSIQVGIDR